LNPTTPSAGAGAAAQVPTQCLSWRAIADLLMRFSRSCRRFLLRRNGFR
jgi:hypothetical protein